MNKDRSERYGAWFNRFLREQDGTTATEYAVMLALILFGAIGVLTLFGGRVDAMYVSIDGAVQEAHNNSQP